MPARRITQDQQWERQRVGATIRELRLARGYSPDQLASLILISRSYLVNIEAGRKPLTKRLLPLIASALNVRQVAIVHPGFFDLEDGDE